MTMMEARAVPEGYENITPHLVVKGAAKAIEFYKKVFWSQRRIPQHNSRRRKQNYAFSINNKGIKDNGGR